MLDASMIKKHLLSFVLHKELGEKKTGHYLRQIGVAELRLQFVVNMVRCLLKQTSLPDSFWLRAVDVAFYLTNHCFVVTCLPIRLLMGCFLGR